MHIINIMLLSNPPCRTRSGATATASSPCSRPWWVGECPLLLRYYFFQRESSCQLTHAAGRG